MFRLACIPPQPRAPQGGAGRFDAPPTPWLITLGWGDLEFMVIRRLVPVFIAWRK